MSIDDINSHRPVGEPLDSYCTEIFHLACIGAMGQILRGHNNVKSFGAKYTVVSANKGYLCEPHWFIGCGDNMGIMLHGYATGDKCFATVVHDNEVRIGIAYRLTNPITHETEISDTREELYPLFLALLHYDKIKGLNDSRGSDNRVFTEQDLKDIVNEYDLDDEPAEVIELR